MHRRPPHPVIASTLSTGGPTASHSQEEKEEEEEKLDSELTSKDIMEIMGEGLSDNPSWEKVLMDRIKAMSVMEKSLVLEAVWQCIQEQNQRLEREEGYGVQELLESLNLNFPQPLEKTFLFHFYGLMLRESSCTDVVKKYAAALLELSHEFASQRAGIALALGITAASHMEVVWAMLEHVGRTKFLRSSRGPSASSQDGRQSPDLHWKWVSSTSLLCYGQMAVHAHEQILPWVDNIASRMVYYYSCSSYDNILKMSFLSAAVMLMRALKRESKAQSYKFTQTPELIRCLLYALQREPNSQATLFQQKIILVIAGLSLRPSLKPLVKSQILQICLQSLYELPPLETSKICLLSQDSGPDFMELYQKSTQALNLLFQTFISENKSLDEVCFLLQHTEPWLNSDKSYERRRVVQSILLLLKCLTDYVRLTEEATPTMLGHQIGLLMLLWRDSDEITRSYSRLCVHFLIQLLIQQKGSAMELMYLNKMKNFEERSRQESDTKFYHLVQALDNHLTVAQHTMLILTLMRGLSIPNHLHCGLACHLLLMIFQDRSTKAEQVAEILQGLFQTMPSISCSNVQQVVLKVVTVLGQQHTQELVEVLLSLCHPSDRQVAPLWKALASHQQLARKVITLLYIKLKLRPPQLLVRLSEPAELVSMLALGTIYELLYIREFKPTVHWAFAGLLLGLLTQLHYLFQLGLVESMSELQEDTLETRPLGPCGMCVEALKGLFWTTNYWEVFAYLMLLRGWELFQHLETYTKGVILLARAMAHYECELKAVLGQAVICLKRSEERDNVVAILIITEFLHSQELTQYMSRKTMNKFLSLGLSNPNRLVRALSLIGLNSVLMQPKKVVLLRNQVAGLMDSFLKPEPKDLMGLMEILGDTVHLLGSQGIGSCSLKLAQRLRQLFEDEQEDVRGGAILLYGEVVYSGGRKYQQVLKSHAFQCLVPLLFHLKDTSPEVVMKTKFTFLRCAILLKWEFRKQLFSKLAWGHGRSAESDIFMCMLESNFSSCHQFLLQASIYLRSPHQHLKRTAMKFIGSILQEYFTNLCFYLKRGEMKHFLSQFEALKQEQDSASRKFYQSFSHEVLELSRYVRQ